MSYLCFITLSSHVMLKLNLYRCGNHKTVHRIIFTAILIALSLFQYWRFAQSRFGKVKPILSLPVTLFVRITLELFTEIFFVDLLEGPRCFAELVSVLVCVREMSD